MANKPLRPCKTIGCPELTHNGYCDKHKIIADANQKARRKRYDSTRPYHGMYGSRWRDERIRFLMLNPFCVECSKDGKLTPANVVDHIKPHCGDYALFWDSINNWQSLCAHHHSKKTAKEDGGFGNKKI